MGIFSSLKSELLGILRNRKLLIAVIGVMTIPLLYSGTYLWAFWDPYGHLDKLPVAVVNNDQGTVYNGEKLKIGNDLVKKLKESKSFNYKFVSEKKADNGLENQKYYIKIEIPEDFSKNAATLQSSNPKKLTLIYTPNEGYNYLSSKIGDSAVEKIKEQVSASVTKTYAESMFDNLKDVASGLTKAGNGAGELNSGINKAQTGAQDLKTGIDSAKSGAADVNDGANQVDSGAKTLKENLQTLAEKSVAFSDGTQSAATGSKQLDAGLTQFGDGLGQLKSGTSDLLAGAKKSNTGASQLASGLDDASKKIPDLQAGSKQVADGASQLSTSMGEWNQGAQATLQGAQKLNQGLQQANGLMTKIEETNDPVEKEQLMATLEATLAALSEGSEEVTDGVSKLSDTAAVFQEKTTELASGANQVSDGQNQLAGGINQLDKGAKDLAGGQDQLTAGLATLNDKMSLAVNSFSQIQQGSTSLNSGINQLASGSTQLKSGTSQLAQGSVELADGTGQLSAGTSKLQSGMSQLASGSSDLASGMNDLSSGSKELKDQLKSGAKDTSDVKANNGVYDMFSQPVKLKSESINKVPDYGTGFAPYFLSLSLFVGALVLSVIFPMLIPAVKPKNGISWFAGKLGVLFIVGIAQALLADAILLKVLGLEVQSVPYFIMLSIIASWTFFAIIQFLVTALDNPGRFIAIILLVLQLTSSAGTYPIELSPSFLQNIAHFMPMTYTVAGFRAVISTGDFGYMWHNIGFTAIFLIAFLAASLVFFITKFKRTTKVAEA